MKSVKQLWLAAAALLLALGTQSAFSATGIAGSKHDFSSGGASAYKGSSSQICAYCHAPHGGSSTAPLWARTDSAATYTLYSNPLNTTLNSTLAQPGGISKLCLSCHDGTLAIDPAVPASIKLAVGITNMGIDLSNDHPIGMTYDATLVSADGGLAAPATVASLLYSSKVECASCHDVHNKLGETKLVRINNTGSALCKTCHTK